MVQRDRICRSCVQISSQLGRGWHESTLDKISEMHEIVYRSATRGLPIEKRINTRNCLLLCRSCHRAVHRKEITIVVDKLRGADGDIAFRFNGLGR